MNEDLKSLGHPPDATANMNVAGKKRQRITSEDKSFSLWLEGGRRIEPE